MYYNHLDNCFVSQWVWGKMEAVPRAFLVAKKQLLQS